MSENSSANNSMAVKVDKDGILTIDGNEKKIEELKGEFFENLVDKALADEVDFIIEDNGIIGSFFTTIKNGTSPDSELRKLYEKTCEDKSVQSEESPEPSNEPESKSKSEEI